MFAKRTIPLVIVFLVGVGTFLAWFVPHPPFPSIVDEHAMGWFDIIASFAMILGALNLLKLQSIKVIRRSRNWQYSIAAILGFFITILFGFVLKGGHYVILQTVPENPEGVIKIIDNEIDAVGKDPTYKVVIDGSLKKLASARELSLPWEYKTKEEARQIVDRIKSMGGEARLSVIPESPDSGLTLTLTGLPQNLGTVIPVIETEADAKGFNKDSLGSLIAALQDMAPRVIRINYFTAGGAQKLLEKIQSAGGKGYIDEVKWGSHLQQEGTYFAWIFFKVFTPLSATMFALLAFFVASASYRAFRIRNVEATVLLVAGIILMLGRVPLGGYLTGWLPHWLSFLDLPVLQEWIYSIPNNAGARAIMIGIALGMVGTSLRVILGIEKSFMGEK